MNEDDGSGVRSSSGRGAAADADQEKEGINRGRYKSNA